jgi:hypothetical protein
MYARTWLSESDDIAFAQTIRAELADPAPQGFAFTDQLFRQDAALEHLTARLRAHPDAGEVERALVHALLAERDGWVLLKLLELTERLAPKGAAEALIKIAQDPPGDEGRARFLAGRACEVLLKLPLGYETRRRANEASKGKLEDPFRYRLGALRERQLQRPRRVEWLLLVVMMALVLGGLLVAWAALDR